MRFHLTLPFSQARTAWESAYRAHDLIASSDDKYTADHSPESKAASDEEYAALERLLIMPAATPTEIAEKLRIMRERAAGGCWTADHPRYMAQIERDLIEAQRPNVSPDVASAFDAWREAHRAHSEDTIGEDHHDDRLCEAHGAAFRALMAVPCTTPGDLIVKLYVDMLGVHGSSWFGPGSEQNGIAGYPFEINMGQPHTLDGVHDRLAQETFERDIRECDLGRCLLALGRVDFDPAAWVAAARRAQMTFGVTIEADGSRGLFTSESDDYERGFICQALLAGGLGIIGKERCGAVADEIEKAHPDLIIDLRHKTPPPSREVAHA